MKRFVFAGVLLLASVTGAALWWLSSSSNHAYTDPFTWRLDAWSAALSGEAGVTSASYTALNAANGNLSESDVEALRSLAVRVSQFELSGKGDVSGKYLPNGTAVDREGMCKSDVKIKSVSAARIPDLDNWVKILVTYTGNCGEKFTSANPGVLWLYAQYSPSGWVEAQPWQVPHVDVPTPVEAVPVKCAQGEVSLAVGVAAAWQTMCDLARKDGVNLEVVSGYVTAQQHAEVFENASEKYGEEIARVRVGFSDGEVCTARVCTGTALSVSLNEESLAWLAQPVKCTAGQLNDGCAGGSAVSRAESFGFIHPSGSEAGYLEYALPTVGAGEGSCVPYGQAVPSQIVSVFKCRLAQAGFDVVTAEQVAREALVVSRCASGWNPNAALFEGKFRNEPNPQTGLTYPYSGLFGLPDSISGGPWAARGVDPVVDEANTAARVYIADRGWSRFYCATGGLPGVQAGPVLAKFGGPDLPEWSKLW